MSLEKLVTPDNKSPLLLHSCCAPCVCDLMQRMLDSDITFSIFFYNPNIHPEKEYLIRKEENIRFAEKLGVEFIDADYDVENWFERAKGLEMEPERGERCTMCFDRRFDVTASYAAEHGFPLITSSLGISRWKNFDQITQCGLRAASKYPNVEYWTFNWRKGGGAQRMYEISKAESFYKQEYCGCIYSLRDTNSWRKKNGRRPIYIGQEFYSLGGSTTNNEEFSSI